MHGVTEGAPVPLNSYGGLVTLADPSSIPEGASPRTYNTDFNVGAVMTRPGLRKVFNASNASIGPNRPTVALSPNWINPLNILLGDGVYTQSVANGTNALTIENFTFSIPFGDIPTGVLIPLVGYATAGSVSIVGQLLKNGVLVGERRAVTMPTVSGGFSLGGVNDTWGTFLSAADINNHLWGVQLTATSTLFPGATAFLDSAQATIGITTGGSNFQYIGTFTQQDDTIKNIALDAAGNLFVEDVTNNPGVLTEIRTDITPNSASVQVNGPDVQFMAFSDYQTGSDMPLQYGSDGSISRITKVGPGAPPAFTPQIASSVNFDIATITQYAAKSNILNPGHISVLLWSAGPGSTQPGNVITVYYSPSFYSGAPQPGAEDKTLVNTFNSGVPTYVFLDGMPFGDGTYLVTSVGNALPPGVDHFRYYFTVQTTTSNYQKQNEAAGTYQQTIGTMTMVDPVPGLEAGNVVTVAGASVADWDTAWPIVSTVNSAEMTITNTAVTASVATYNYAVIGAGSPPAAGELVTVTGTTNANGQLNVTNAVIQTSTGGGTGSFTLSVPVVTAASSPESGQATTAGTIFTIDPGPVEAGTVTSPIFGNSTGGTLTFTAADAQLIGVGTRQGSVFFIYPNGYYTFPAPPVTFTCPENTTGIVATNIPIGPPGVIGRGVIVTEAGQNGVPGANFFTIPTPVDYIVNNQTYTASSLLIQDNTSTSASFTFTDSVLLNALAVDVYGYNLFNQIEIGDPGWLVSYNSRMWYGLCRNKVQNFNNLSFDGGYLPAQQQGQLVPLGWSTPDQNGGLVVSPRSGNAYYISNSTGSTLSVAGLISQSAYQDAYKQPIILPNTLYSVRVTARIPSASLAGNLVITLTANGITYGTYTLPFTGMSTDYGIYSGTLLTTAFTTVPTGLTLNVSATTVGNGADVEIDRIEPYPTAIPVLLNTIYGSYAGLSEQVDAVTGQVQTSNENQQPCNGAVVMYDTLYLLKGSIEGTSMYSLQSSANLEPAQWDEPEVAQKSGSIGILAYDFGEQWIVMANRNGLYLFEGGQPGKITQEIYQIWDSIYWPSANKIWVKNDVIHRKLYVGIPLPTPNFWMPNAPVNQAPVSPNVILMLNYQGLDSGETLKFGAQMHTTMFGALNSTDERRKWSLWDIASPYANIVTDALPMLITRRIGHITYTFIGPGPIDEGLYICNGSGTSTVYYLDSTSETDDGVAIDSLYTTAGLVEATKKQTVPIFGPGYARWSYMTVQLQSSGNVQCRLLPNILIGPDDDATNYNAWTVPGGFSPGNPALYDCEMALNFYAMRTFWEFRENDGHGFSLSNFVGYGKQDTWNRRRGIKAGVLA